MNHSGSRVIKSRFHRTGHTSSSQSFYLLPAPWHTANAKTFERIAKRVVNTQVRTLSIAELLSDIKERLSSNNENDWVHAWASLCEIMHQTLGMKPYWTQVMAAMISLSQRIAEMDTGEGKSLSTLLAAGWAHLHYCPVHIITANDYLAERDALESLPFAQALNIKVTTLLSGDDPDTREAAFSGEWIFTTGKELVFEFLRDKLYLKDATDPLRQAIQFMTSEKTVNRPVFKGLGLALIDEADSVLIDEASTPCVISGEGGISWTTDELKEALVVAQQLIENQHFTVHSAKRMLTLTDEGKAEIRHIETSVALVNRLYRQELVMMALKALYLFNLGVEYVVQDDSIVIIDGLTGRPMPDRRWEQGLHEMIEIKEGCPLSPSRATLGKLNYKQFFEHYAALGGMTGTALEIKKELKDVYDLRVMRVPRYFPSKRVDKGVSWYFDADTRNRDLIDKLKRYRKEGKAVLIGAPSIAVANELSLCLNTKNVAHQLLDGVQDANEAELIAQAGKEQQITIATSVAGRGTDIKLDDEVMQNGGLHVILIGFLRFYRMDRQLIGRSARQSDPGSFEILCTAQDDILESFWYPKPIARKPSRIFTHWLRFLQMRNERQARLARKSLNKWELDRRSWLSFLKII